MINYLIGGALILIVGFILYKMIRGRRVHKGGCCGDCSRCKGC